MRVRPCMCAWDCAFVGPGRAGGALLGLQNLSLRELALPVSGLPQCLEACLDSEPGPPWPLSVGQSGRWRGVSRHWHEIRKTGPPTPRTLTPHLVLVLVLRGTDLPSNLCFPFLPLSTLSCLFFLHF